MERIQRSILEARDTPLPADRAFVVQFRVQADPDAGIFVGRVEHIASGLAERFASADELIAFVRKVLVPATPPAGAEEGEKK